VVLYGCGTWTLTLREEYKLRMFENRVLTGGWRKLHNKELHNLYSLPSIIRMIKSKRMRWAEHGEGTGIHREYWWESQKENQDVGVWIIPYYFENKIPSNLSF
jgi:hypothetical protein